MRWGRSLLVALLSAAIGMLAAGFVASLAVGWYHVSSFEGGSGYFVVAFALLGFLVGAITGFVVSRRTRTDRTMPFVRALGVSALLLLVTAAAVGGTARLRADVAPTLDGQPMMLAVEVRWPTGQVPPPVDTTEWSLRLSASSNHVLRVSETGPLWREDARLENGRWIVPGAVEVFTSRGERVLDVEPTGIVRTGWVVPLPAYPRSGQLAWSEWFPHARDGEAALPEGFSYRYRVVPRNQPIRTERIGPWEVRTIASDFNLARYGSEPARHEATAQFEIRLAGQRIVLADSTSHADALSVIPGNTPALLAASDRTGACYLLQALGISARVQRVASCASGLSPYPLTNDSALFQRAWRTHIPRGRIDREQFNTPGQYLFTDGALDTRALAIRAVTPGSDGQIIEKVPPLGLSPDGRSYARIAFAGESADQHAIQVADMFSGQRYSVPANVRGVAGTDYESLDPAWLQHYFMWQSEGGVDRLVARPNVVPLPYRGRLTTDESGYREYRLSPALAGLRDALADFVVAEFAGQRQPATPDAYSVEVRTARGVANIGYSSSDGNASVFMDRGTDSRLVADIARRFDAALATRKYDHLFKP